MRESAKKNERNCQKINKNRWAELVASYLERPEAVIAAKGAATKYWTKVIDTDVPRFIFWKHLQELQPNLSSLCYEVSCAAF